MSGRTNFKSQEIVLQIGLDLKQTTVVFFFSVRTYIRLFYPKKTALQTHVYQVFFIRFHQHRNCVKYPTNSACNVEKRYYIAAIATT